MKDPIAFVYGNCVFGGGPDDGWAAFSVELSSYAWLDRDEKHARFLGLVAAIEAIEADFQILRVAGAWDAEAYGRRTAAEEASTNRSRERTSYVNGQLDALRETVAAEPAMFVLVSLREPELDVGAYVSRFASESPRDWWRGLLRAVTLRDRHLLGAQQLERMRVRADGIHALLSDYLPVRPARTVELQWLVRRAFCRGAGEPVVDARHEPRALIFECNGEAALAPLEGDILRWFDSEVEQGARHLRIEAEAGTSWQAHLVLGALPERLSFPGPRAELMFAPPEGLPFGVDIGFTARFLPNELALRIARRKVQDADQVLRAESDGEQGVSDQGYERTQEARDLLSYLQASSRPPLLRAVFAIAVGARSPEELELRVESVRRAFGEIRLHRPLGDQLPLFLQHLPGQRARVVGFDDTLTSEQVAAMMPTATHAVGARRGFYLGHTLSGSRRPVLFNLAEGSERDGNATILSIGALGTGKTTLAQKFQYEAFLQGARVVDCDPKGDHGFHLLDDVAPHVDRLDLRPDAGLRGMLDPLRVAPEHIRQEAAVSFLRDLLPGRAEPAWETAIIGAVERVLSRARRPTCVEVVRALAAGSELEAQVASTLAVYARSGLTQLGFADAGAVLPRVGRRQVTYVSIRDLPAAPPGASRSDYSQSERIGEQVVRLIAMFALDLLRRERSRLKLFSFDEGWRLLADPIGRTLLASLQRMGRSELAVPIISTQLVNDALVGERESFESLIGATFVFGVRSHAEAARALTLLGLDAEDRDLRRRLIELQAGRCLFRDHCGRVEAIQVELLLPALRRAFSTTPTR